MLATGRPIVHSSHTARLQSTFEALSLIMPEQLQHDHVYHAESLLLSSKHGSSITGALQVMLFLFSNNFLDMADLHGWEHDKVIEVLLDVLPQTDGWAALMSQQYTELPVSIQSALDRLFKEAVLRSDLNLIRSLTQMGVDANQVLNNILVGYGNRGAASAFGFAMSTNNCPLIQLLIDLDANRPTSNLELMQSAWEYRNTPRIMLESMTFLLSNFVFCQEGDEEEDEAHQLLGKIASAKACPITEQIFEFFRTRLHTPASKSELLTSAIKAQSKILLNLLSEDQEHVGAFVNHINLAGATPIMAAIEVGDTKVLGRLIHLGAFLDPPSLSSSTSCSPLQYAAYVSDTDMLQQILWHGAKINYCHPSISGFDWPIKGEWVSLIDFTSVGKTALQSALLGCKAENAIFLLEAGATSVGSELAIAVAFRQDAVIHELLARGASFSETSTISDILSVLEAAVLAEDMALISRIINNSSQAVGAFSLWAAIFVAQCTSVLSIFEFLLARISATSQSDDPCLGTAMYLAAIFGHFEIVELMLASGLRPEKYLAVGDVFDTSSLGDGDLLIPDDYLLWRQDMMTIHNRDYKEHDLLESALSLSASRGSKFLILLRQHGYHRTIRCPDFESCPSLEELQTLQSFGVEMSSRILSSSIRDGSHDVTEWLIASGIDVNVTSNDTSDYRDTPIQAAAKQGNLPLVERLKILGADINAPAYTDDATALQYASIQGYFGLARRLLEFQADPNAPRGQSYLGRTALEGAAENGRLDVVQLLLNSGVETLSVGRFQYVRAIRYARKQGHHAVARLIKSHRLWEEADQRLFDDKNLLDYEGTYESDEGTDEEETDEEYESSRATSEAEFETSGVSCEVPGEIIEVDDERGGDSNTDFSRDEEFPDYSTLVSYNIEEGLAYGVDEKVELPGDAIWAETCETSPELQWLITGGRLDWTP
ncbi:hypothetical protein LZ30DRAFT_712307 [Colletotrichum cereale]|nr:hypothetical protein LZ30DRAFT_712307 [Colletotrichum cereale]